MKRLIILLLIGTNAVLSEAQSLTQRIDSVMQLAYQRGIYNGNILVAKGGNIIYRHSLGFANGNKTTPLHDSLRFDIGSVSKEFNGAGIMILKEKGKLSLDDPLSLYFPEFPSWARQVKIRHLINYTSGIPLPQSTVGDTDSALYNYLRSVKELALAPGTGYIYNHANVYLQMRIIEKVSKNSYAQFLAKNIFEPAGMSHTVVDYPVGSPGMAQAFDNNGQNTPYGQVMSGWVRLPIDDLYKWTQALEHYRILSEKSLAELAVNFPGGESSLGSTGFENGKLIWHQHQGSNSNYEATIYSWLPDSITIVMMTNNQQMKVLPLKTALMNVLQNKPVTVPKKSFYLEIREKMLTSADSGLAYYHELKAYHQDKYDFSFEIGDLISTGKYVGRRAHYDDAIRIYRLAAELPARAGDKSYAYELIGQAFQSKNDKEQALLNYKKALEIDPENKNAAGMIEALRR
ncbi:CubicO group peptidase (beta-lactamase class C family) [Mucilaginibacter rubeus]|uniref:serine hydrolase n=1 Tax=Mucilaginibacter rubeus TaxID=2027860 RepID=UPI00339907F2